MKKIDTDKLFKHAMKVANEEISKNDKKIIQLIIEYRKLKGTHQTL